MPGLLGDCSFFWYNLLRFVCTCDTVTYFLCFCSECCANVLQLSVTFCKMCLLFCEFDPTHVRMGKIPVLLPISLFIFAQWFRIYTQTAKALYNLLIIYCTFSIKCSYSTQSVVVDHVEFVLQQFIFATAEYSWVDRSSSISSALITVCRGC